MPSRRLPDLTDRFPEPIDLRQRTHTLASPRYATVRQLLPTHRAAVIAKTPMLVALGCYLAGGRFDTPAIWWTMALSAALWAFLYPLNESTDLIHEQHFHMDRRVQAILFLLPLVVCLLAWPLSPWLTLLFALMLAGQLAYCAPPLRLKRYWWAILVLSGTLNPVLRLQCGALWGGHPISNLAYGAVVALHLGASLRSRGLLRDRDQKLGYHVLPPGGELIGAFCTGAGFLGAFRLCANGALPGSFGYFLALAAGFAVYAWSGRETNVARLRQGWLWFAIVSCFALAALLSRR